MSVGEIHVAISSDQDIVSARQKGRVMAAELTVKAFRSSLAIRVRGSRIFDRRCETASPLLEVSGWGSREYGA